MRQTLTATIALVAAFAAAPVIAQDAAEDAASAEMVLEFVADGKTYVGDPAKGERVFRQCMACHTIKPGQNRVGPTLYGIIGRPAGTVEGFNYSKANQESGKVWTPQEIFDYLENPRRTIPGTKMAFAGLRRPQDRADVLAYIQENSK